MDRIYSSLNKYKIKHGNNNMICNWYGYTHYIVYNITLANRCKESDVTKYPETVPKATPNYI